MSFKKMSFITVWFEFWFWFASKRLLVTSRHYDRDPLFVCLKNSLCTSFFGPSSDNLYGGPMSSFAAAMYSQAK